MSFPLTIKGYITIPSNWARSQSLQAETVSPPARRCSESFAAFSLKFTVLALLPLPLGLLPRFLRYLSRRFHHLLIRRKVVGVAVTAAIAIDVDYVLLTGLGAGQLSVGMARDLLDDGVTEDGVKGAA